MDIQDAEGETVATVKKALITPLRDRWKVEAPDGPEMNIQSNILNHDRIEAGRKKAAEISKKWFRIRDTYGVEIAPGQDNAFILTITAALDQMAHD